MNATSNYTTGQQIVINVWTHKHPHPGKTMNQMRDNFQH